MSPKEKAKHLFDLMYDSMTPNFGRYEISKRQALIAVDEILKILPTNEYLEDLGKNIENREKVYWKEVKQEIEKL